MFIRNSWIVTPNAQHHSMFTLYAAQTQVLPAEISPNQILPPDHYMF